MLNKWWPWLALAVAGAAGLALRIALFGQSLVGDEMSTFWIISHNGLGGTLSTVASDAEITPPLYFLLAEVSSRLGSNPDLIRLPSIVAGIAFVPVIHQVALRLIGGRAALIAAAIGAVSPLLVYFSANARAYSLMLLLLAGSTLFLLLAARSGRRRWWAGYAICICLAMYTHYTAVFLILGQFLWALWALPEARRPLLVASGLAALAFAPWLPGWLDDLNSPTTEILSGLQSHDLGARWVSVQQTVFLRTGTTESYRLFDRPELLLILGGLLLATVVLVVRRMKGLSVRFTESEVPHGGILVLVLTLAAPVGITLYGLVGTDVFGIREIASVWVGLPLLIAMLISATGRWPALAAATLVIAGLTLGSIHLADSSKSAFAYRDLAAWIDENAGPEDAVLDQSHLTPSPSTPLDAYLPQTRPEFRLNLPLDRPDYITSIFSLPPRQPIIDAAFSGDRDVFLATIGGPLTYDPATGTARFDEQVLKIPRGWEVVGQKEFDGLKPLTVTEFSRS